MKQTFTTLFVPICLIIIAVLSLYHYVRTGEIMYPQLSILFILLPNAIVGVKPEMSSYPYFKYFRNAMLIIGIILLITFGITEM